jgi:nucleotide-binding universal stress UspA family protein
MPSLFRRILVPHDFSDHATDALRTALELARERRGRVIVLHAIVPFEPIAAIPPGEMAMLIPPAELIAEARKRLEALVQKLAAGPHAPRTDCRVVIGDPYQCILEAARDADSIVMATAGRTGLAHLLIGSVAEKVVRHAPVPVLTIRPARSSRPRARRASRPGSRR